MDLFENRISDLEVYLTRMQRSVLDKLFFIDKVFEPFENIIDFGCANGEVIRVLRTMCPEYNYIGYDISEEMIRSAEKNVPEAFFCSRWEDIPVPFEKSLLNISSTIHEVYSYGTAADIEEFIGRVFSSGFRYITVRDMMFSDSDDRPADGSALKTLRESVFADKLKDFESFRGEITTQKQLVHFLLKYRYTQNWEREVREDYFPISVESFMKLIPESYTVTYFDHFTLPYTAWQIRRDLGIDLTDRTHIKLILERKI